ncbi:MAG TPA: hypothetical protein VJM31_06995 [Vicinamibacterales bacterium]|nr:hypothetical protein [Vicinamibacterales bacterium]
MDMLRPLWRFLSYRLVEQLRFPGDPVRPWGRSLLNLLLLPALYAKYGRPA